MSISKETHTDEQPTIQKERRNSARHIILVLDDIAEYYRIKELGDLIKYHSKLMSYYGFNIKVANRILDYFLLLKLMHK